MSLDRINLDPYFLAKIYAQPIIPGVRVAPPKEEKEAPKLKYLGENQKNIALLIQNENEAYLNDELFNLLTNILNACKLGMQDVALINLAQQPATSLSTIKKSVVFNKCVAFGISPEQLGYEDIPPFQIQQLGDISLVFSHDLQVINNDKAMKGQLWQALKVLFNV
ncbi:hypothetical protein LX64_04374 [Chitinophaga skermanii]|uniref:DNA polymerase III psi subunit n=1 Tax=Chitinophaga skermanii TaxID=331697 RepID=A0A327Q7Z3_9BACT|nr:hypothetical protein [Chitinophaga skermanii]RAI99821.1 hypothetical protein LX64_04374 [Chitinophaga skermanii]